METGMHVAGTKIRIETPVPLKSRLFGVPFLAMGLFVAGNLVMSVRAVLSGAVTAEQAIGGQLLTAVFLLTFAVPGAALVFGRRILVIDRSAKSAAELRKLSFFNLRTATIPLEHVRLVRAALRLKPAAGGGQAGISYDAELIDGKGVKLLTAGMFGTSWDAVRLGKKLAAALSLPFEDLTVEEQDAG